MSELSDAAKQLIEAARSGDEITEADKQLVTRGLTARLGAAVLTGTAVSTSLTSTAAAGVTPGGVVAKPLVMSLLWGAGGLGLGLAAMGAASALRRPSVSETAPSVSRAAPAPRSTFSPSGAGSTAPATAADASRERQRPHAFTGSTLAPRANDFAEPDLRPSPEPAEASSSLNEEVALLRNAHAALQGGDPQRALTILDDHALRYRNGVLREERAAQRIFALCGAGRSAEAVAEARRFVENAPRSPLVPRVRASCVADSVR